MKTFHAQTVVYQEGKFFVAQCLNVDVSSFGKSYQEAVKNLQEALELYLEHAPKSPPKVSHPALTDLTVTYA
jgi:predicted RNase H-like HicB family nuclease